HDGPNDCGRWRATAGVWRVKGMPDMLRLPHAPSGALRLAYGTDPNQFGDLWLPSGAGPHPVVVFLHGGYWRARYDISYTHPIAADLAARGIAVWNLEYRRVGQSGGGWPGTFEDVARGFDALHDLAQQHSLDLARVVVMGHSAGGHLAFWLAAGKRGITTSQNV